MRKFLAVSLLAGSLGAPVVTGVLLASPAGADPVCSANTPLPGTPLGDVSVSAPSGANTGGTLQVCSENSPVINGTVTASGTAAPPGGYAIANGNDAGPGPTGYIGVEGGTGGVDVVGCYTGDYNNGSGTAPTTNDGQTDANGNNVIASTSGQVDTSTLTGPCSVKNEKP